VLVNVFKLSTFKCLYFDKWEQKILNGFKFCNEMKLQGFSQKMRKDLTSSLEWVTFLTSDLTDILEYEKKVRWKFYIFQHFLNTPFFKLGKLLFLLDNLL
jgi:hypothetical protein